MTWYDWRAEDALTDPPACVCDRLPYEHGWTAGACGEVPKPPLGGRPIWDEQGRIVGQHPAPPPVRPS